MYWSSIVFSLKDLIQKISRQNQLMLSTWQKAEMLSHSMSL